MGAFVGDPVGALVGPPVGLLVGPLVGQVSLSPALRVAHLQPKKRKRIGPEIGPDRKDSRKIGFSPDVLLWGTSVFLFSSWELFQDLFVFLSPKPSFYQAVWIATLEYTGYKIHSTFRGPHKSLS